MIGVFVILFVLNAQLAFYAMLPVPFLLVGTQWYAVVALARYRLVRQAVGSLNALLHENLKACAKSRRSTVLATKRPALPQDFFWINHPERERVRSGHHDL